MKKKKKELPIEYKNWQDIINKTAHIYKKKELKAFSKEDNDRKESNFQEQINRHLKGEIPWKNLSS